MDRAEVWKLEDNIMPQFIDQRDFDPANSQHHYLFSTEGQFESSFSSSVTSYDECYTPSRRDSFAISDLEGLSSSRTSSGSTGSSTPVDESIFYPMTSLNHMVKNESDNKRQLYVTPCHKGVEDPNMTNMTDYVYPQVNDMYGTVGLQDDFSGLPGMMFDSLSGLLFHDTASPLPMTSSPDNFVVPSQTFISEPYRPTTPNNISRTVLGSPLEECGQLEETIKYFMSPRETHSQTPSSSSSSGSNSTSMRTPSSQTLETSVALHRIQSIGSSRVRKQSKRSSLVTSKVDCVAKGQFRCDYPGCKSERGFKRHEHLKRHQKTHVAPKDLHCPFCIKSFQLDRFDNYQAHVRLHNSNKKGARTKYFPEAQLLIDSWDKKDKADQKLGMPGEIYRVCSRRVKARGMIKSRL
jgi:hypothetical protein